MLNPKYEFLSTPQSKKSSLDQTINSPFILAKEYQQHVDELESENFTLRMLLSNLEARFNNFLESRNIEEIIRQEFMDQERLIAKLSQDEQNSSTMNEDLQDKLLKALEENQRLQNEIRANHIVNSLTDDTFQLESDAEAALESTSLRAKLENLENADKNNQDIIRNLQLQITELTQKVSELTQENDELTKNNPIIENLQNSLKSLIDENTVLRQKIQELTKNSQARDDMPFIDYNGVEELIQNLENATETIDQLRAENEKLKSKISNLQNDNKEKASLQNKLENANNLLFTERNEKENLQKVIASLVIKFEGKDVNSAITNHENLVKENKELKMEINDLKNSFVPNEKIINELKEKVNQLEKNESNYKQMVNEVNNELASLQQVNENLVKEKNELHQRLNQQILSSSQSIKSQNLNVTPKYINQKTFGTFTLSSDEEKTEEDLLASESMSILSIKDLSDLKNINQKLQEENDTLKNKQISNEKIIEELQIKNRKITEENETLKNKEIKNLRLQNKKLDENSLKLKKELENLTKQNQELKKENETNKNVKKEFEELNYQHNEKSKELETLKILNQKLTEQNKLLRRALKHSKTRSSYLQNETTENLSSTYSGSRKTNELIREDSLSLQTENLNLNENYLILQNENKKLKKQNHKLIKKFETIQSEIEKSSILEENEKLSKEINNLTEEIKILKTKLKSPKNKINRIKQKSSEIEKKLKLKLEKQELIHKKQIEQFINKEIKTRKIFMEGFQQLLELLIYQITLFITKFTNKIEPLYSQINKIKYLIAQLIQNKSHFPLVALRSDVVNFIKETSEMMQDLHDAATACIHATASQSKKKKLQLQLTKEEKSGFISLRNRYNINLKRVSFNNLSDNESSEVLNTNSSGFNIINDYISKSNLLLKNSKKIEKQKEQIPKNIFNEYIQQFELFVKSILEIFGENELFWSISFNTCNTEFKQMMALIVQKVKIHYEELINKSIKNSMNPQIIELITQFSENVNHYSERLHSEHVEFIDIIEKEKYDHSNKDK